MKLALLLTTAVVASPACAGPISSRIYPAPKVALSLDGLPEGARLIEVATADRLRLNGIAITAKPGRPTLLLLHGNGSSAASITRWLAPLAATGYGIVAADYRGYSANPGSPSEQGLAADADAFYAFAKAQAGDAPVYVIGHSLGGGVAFGLSTRQRLAALITIGAYDRLKTLVPRIARAFVSDEYDNRAAAAKLDEPYFLIHGTTDRVVPAVLGRDLGQAAERAGKSGVAYFITDAGHQPDPAIVAALIDDADALVSGRTRAAPPAGVQIFAFGRFAGTQPRQVSPQP